LVLSIADLRTMEFHTLKMTASGSFGLVVNPALPDIVL
jgi:hypothetical protein